MTFRRNVEEECKTRLYRGFATEEKEKKEKRRRKKKEKEREQLEGYGKKATAVRRKR